MMTLRGLGHGCGSTPGLSCWDCSKVRRRFRPDTLVQPIVGERNSRVAGVRAWRADRFGPGSQRQSHQAPAVPSRDQPARRSGRGERDRTSRGGVAAQEEVDDLDVAGRGPQDDRGRGAVVGRRDHLAGADVGRQAVGRGVLQQRRLVGRAAAAGGPGARRPRSCSERIRNALPAAPPSYSEGACRRRPPGSPLRLVTLAGVGGRHRRRRPRRWWPPVAVAAAHPVGQDLADAEADDAARRPRRPAGWRRYVGAGGRRGRRPVPGGPRGRLLPRWARSALRPASTPSSRAATASGIGSVWRASARRRRMRSSSAGGSGLSRSSGSGSWSLVTDRSSRFLLSGWACRWACWVTLGT